MSDAAHHFVLLLETIDAEAEARLREGAQVTLSESPGEMDAIVAAGAGPVHAIITRGKGRVTGALLNACPDVRVVARCGVGLDNVDVDAATARSVPVVNLPGSNARTIAEHTIMLMLGVTRGCVDWANSVRDGQWMSRSDYHRDELHGSTVGVVGLGNIGRRVAEVCRALGTHVVYADPVVDTQEFERVSLDDLLARADVITLHCALTEGTRRLIDAAAIERMKPGAILINTARGAIIDQDALTDALHGGHLGGFGADVLDVEPPDASDPLLSTPNVIITPHVGSLTRSTYKDMCLRSVENVLGILGGGEPKAGTVFNAAALAARSTKGPR